MAQNTEVTTETPVSDSTIEAVAHDLRIDSSIVRSLLDAVQADVEEYDLVGEFDEYHEHIGTEDDVEVWLATHGTEVDELASHAGWEGQVELPVDVSRESIVRRAMDLEARDRYAHLFGGKQDAVNAVGNADALIVRQ